MVSCKSREGDTISQEAFLLSHLYLLQITLNRDYLKYLQTPFIHAIANNL